MSDPSGKAKGRGWRGRLVVLLLLLFVVAAAGWWQWPRGDRRFIGRWQMDTAAIGTGEMMPTCQLEFRHNGTATIADLDGSMVSVPFSWEADASTITFGERPFAGPAFLADLSLQLRMWWSGSQVLAWPADTCEILTANANRVELMEKDKRLRVLTRLAE